MEPSQNPFSLYDFLGYLIPGFLFMFLFVSITKETVCNLVIPVFVINLIKADSLYSYLFLTFFCYFVGHVLSYLSSVTIEKYSIWTLGYPSCYMLKHKIPGFWCNYWKNFVPKQSTDKNRCKICVFFATAFSWIMNCIRLLVKLAMCISILPVVLVDITIRRIFKFREFLGKPLDQFLSEKIQLKIDHFVKDQYPEQDQKLDEGGKASSDIEPRDPDFFRLIYHFVNEYTKNHYAKMQNYVALYGFARTMCFSSIVLFWALLIPSFCAHQPLSSYLWPTTALFLVSSVLYLDFNKFYRRYTLEALMAFTAIYTFGNPLPIANFQSN